MLSKLFYQRYSPSEMLASCKRKTGDHMPHNPHNNVEKGTAMGSKFGCVGSVHCLHEHGPRNISCVCKDGCNSNGDPSVVSEVVTTMFGTSSFDAVRAQGSCKRDGDPTEVATAMLDNSFCVSWCAPLVAHDTPVGSTGCDV